MNWKDIQFFLNFNCNIPGYLVYPIQHISDWLYVKKFPPGTLIEDCSYHPCIIKSINSDGDIEAYDIVGNYMTFCSLFHCGIVKLTTDEVIEMVNVYKEKGDKGLISLRTGIREEDIK